MPYFFSGKRADELRAILSQYSLPKLSEIKTTHDGTLKDLARLAHAKIESISFLQDQLAATDIAYLKHKEEEAIVLKEEEEWEEGKKQAFEDRSPDGYLARQHYFNYSPMSSYHEKTRQYYDTMSALRTKISDQRTRLVSINLDKEDCVRALHVIDSLLDELTPGAKPTTSSMGLL